MRAFVAGATGYTGHAVVRELTARGVETHAHVRPDSPSLDEWRERFTSLGAYVDVTPWIRDAMTDTMRRISPRVVFALLGTTRARAKRDATGAVPDSYAAVDYGLTRMLLDALLAASLRPRFIYLSSAGVSDRARGEYLQVRARFERELRESGLPFVIARPSIITGSDRQETRPAERVAASVFDGVLRVAGVLGAQHLSERYHSTSADVLARALVRLAMDPMVEDTVIESEGLRA
jgi:nucleoside-diphosphate-sugar epimerase